MKQAIKDFFKNGGTPVTFIFCCLMLYVFCVEMYENKKDFIQLSRNISIEENNLLGEHIYSVINSEDTNIYNDLYRSVISYKYNKLKKENYTIYEPFIAYNLYGTNLLGLNLYFQTDIESYLDYTVHVEDEKIPDFSRTLNNGEKDNLTKAHEYQLIGLVKGYKNTILLELKDKTGNVLSTKEFQIDLSNLETNSQLFATVTEGESKESLEDGLYTICGNDSDEQDYMSAYDNGGILRSEIPIIGYRSHRILFTDQGEMLFSISQTRIVKMSRLGEVLKIYRTGQYLLHHDYVFSDDGNILVLANNTEKDTEEDCIIKINLETSEVTELIDFEPMFQSYVDICYWDKESARDEGEDGLDWLHLNSIVYVDGDIIVSSRETSSIIKVKNIETTPTLDYIISNEKIWSGSDYTDYLYTQVGDFKIHAGQHSLNYTASEEDGVYYLSFFDNNYGNSTSRPDFDFTKVGITNQNGFSGDFSYYYVYKIDENKKTFELMDSLELVYSGIVSNIQNLGNGNLLTDSGTVGYFAEYDKEHQLIRGFSLTLNKYMVYRVFKYNYHDVWFYSK